MASVRFFRWQPWLAAASALAALYACSARHAEQPSDAPLAPSDGGPPGQSPDSAQGGGDPSPTDPGDHAIPPGDGPQAPASDPSASPELPPVGLYYGRNVEVTPSVVGAMRAIAARNPSRGEAVFMKVGDSITANCSAFCCFAASAGAPVSLDAYAELAPTVRYFDTTRLPSGDTSWSRPSSSAAIGVWSGWPLDLAALPGGVSPLQSEIAATNPRFAVVMLGTNDLVGADPEWQLGPRILRTYARNLTRIVDTLSAAGIISLLTYIPPAYTTVERERLTPAFNAIVRGVATAAQLPTIDFYTDMAALGTAGTIGDGVHPRVYPTSGCVLTPEGLGYGYNLRNLRTLQVLDHVRTAMLTGTAAVPEAPVLHGRGTAASPLVIAQLPFALKLPLAGPGVDGTLDDYRGCGGQGQQSGNEWVFTLPLEGTQALRIMAVPVSGACEAGGGPLRLCAGTRDVSVELFAGTLAPAACLRADATMIETTLQAGAYLVVVDSFAVANDGYVLLTIDNCLPGDPACL